jgi:mono/diheme cytochrome c family protein
MVMPIRCSAMRFYVLAGFWFLISLGGGQLFAPTSVHAQADASGSRQNPARRPSAPAATGAIPGRALFQKHCAKCHGADGTGSPGHGPYPEIPDFTDASWQARRGDARLRASILDGKGQEMPTWREEMITEDQARRLVARVRAFASSTGESGQGKQEAPIPAEPTEAKSPECPSERLIAWVGKFHPAAVHFRIALLTAAAVAEFLRLATGNSIFEPVARFCVWLGLLTAVGAAALGWSAANARLTDASWVLTAHHRHGLGLCPRDAQEPAARRQRLFLDFGDN